MALYFPPLFCGQGSILKVIKEFDIDYVDGETMTVTVGEKCVVDEIIGYGFNLKKDNQHKEFRIINSSMPIYFEIIDKVEYHYDLGYFDYKEKEGQIIRLQRDFEIENVIKITAGQQFLHFVDRKSDSLFHDFFSPESMQKVLRMKDKEFEEYFK